MDSLSNLSNKTILLTGGSGFLGTVLAVRFILDTPIQRLILLVRGGRSRLKTKWEASMSLIFAQPLLDSTKLIVCDGDVNRKSLGLSEEDLGMIRDATDILIHAASTVNLGLDVVRVAPDVIDGALETARFAFSCSKLENFIYVSTAGSSGHLLAQGARKEVHIEEKLYSQSSYSVEDELQAIRQGVPLLGTFSEFPTGYMYAKHLAERLLMQLFDEVEKPTMLICRPTIITSARTHPQRGFAIEGSMVEENIAEHLSMATSDRVVFASRGDGSLDDISLDNLPVDVVANNIIIHASRCHSGIAHIGCRRSQGMSLRALWERAMVLRQRSVKPEVTFKDLPWRTVELERGAKHWAFLGCPMVFDKSKQEALDAEMDETERKIFPVF